tara:strand:- start:4478 stop:5677 length:1200 start_codon:yes stop_codon:yes gene_type:complete
MGSPMNHIDPNSEAVVLVGGGFAGLATAFELSRSAYSSKIILIEPKQYFVFSPLLYELLSREINLWEIAYSYRSLIEGQGIVWIEDHVTKIDAHQKQVIISSGLKINYSKLVLATGSKPNNCGIPGVSDFALMFHCLADVEALRKLIIKLRNSNKIQSNLIIIGAGATGVELACKVSDLLRGQTTIYLIESAKDFLSNAKSFNREQAKKAINLRDIKVYLSTEVTEISADMVFFKHLNQGEPTKSKLPYDGVIWTAGSLPLLPEIIPKPHLSNGRIKIDSYLNAIDYEDVIAIGDTSFHEEMPYPSNAQLAIQQGEFVAKNLIFSNKGFMTKSFTFNNLGEMLSLGIGKASLAGLGLKISGSVAFQIRRMTYLTKIPKPSLGLRLIGAWLLGHGKNANK